MPKEKPLTQAEVDWLDRMLGLRDFLPVDSPEALKASLPSLTLLACAKGEELVREGEQGTELFILYKGALSVRRKGWLLSKEVGRLAPGDIFGEVGFLVQSPRSATVLAAGEGEVFRLESSDMEKVLNENPRLARKLSEQAGERMSKLTGG